MGLFSKWFNKDSFVDMRLVAEMLADFGITKSKSEIEEIAMLYTVIGKRAEYCSQAEFIHKVNDKIIENSPVVNLIKNPNGLQTQKEFIYQYVFFLSIYGANYIESVIPVAFDFSKAMLINLNPNNLTVPDYSYNDFRNENDIKDYVYDFGTGQVKIKSKDIIVTYDDMQQSSNLLKGTSKSKAGELIFQNSQLRLEADNVLTDKPGGIGVLSTGNKEMNGITVPLSPDEKEKLHNQLKNYGVSKGKRNIILSSASLNYMSLANPIKDWDLYKNTERDFILAANLFNQPKEFYMANAKYNDKVAAEIKYYSGDPKSTMESFANSLLRYYKQEGVIEVNYDHVPIMQEKRKQEAEYLNQYFSALKLALELGADATVIQEKVNEVL